MIQTVDQAFDHQHYSTMVLEPVVAIAMPHRKAHSGSNQGLGVLTSFFSGPKRYCRRWQNLMEY